MKLIIQIVLIVGIVVMGFLVYNSIDSRVDFEKESEARKDVVIERLKDIRAAQLAYREVKGEFTSNFDTLINFVEFEKLPVIRQIGSLEDSAAVAEGRVIRDTIYVNVKDTVFSRTYLQKRLNPFTLDSIRYIPYSEGTEFEMDAGVITRNNVDVNVFYVFAPYGEIFKGMDMERYNVKKAEGLSVGSMTEPSTSGNWE